MHSLFEKACGLTHDVIGSAIEVHKDKGPGLLESIYEWCLSMEPELRGFSIKSQDNRRSLSTFSSGISSSF